MKFEWDPGKRAANLLKHGVDFQHASKVFEGVVFTQKDSRQNYGETRYNTIGTLDGRHMVIVHTNRGNGCRIISMRKANEREKQRYQERLEAH